MKLQSEKDGLFKLLFERLQFLSKSKTTEQSVTCLFSAFQVLCQNAGTAQAEERSGCCGGVGQDLH